MNLLGEVEICIFDLHGELCFFIIELHSPENDLKVGEIMIRHRYQLFRLNGEKILKPDCPWPDPDGVHGTIVCIPEEKTGARHI